MPEIRNFFSSNNISPKRLLIIFLIISIYTGLLFVLSYWFFEKSGKFDTLPEIKYANRTIVKEASPSVKIEDASVKVAEISNIDGWINLTSEGPGFSLQYPPSYTVEQVYYIKESTGDRVKYNIRSKDYERKSTGHCPPTIKGASLSISANEDTEGNFYKDIKGIIKFQRTTVAKNNDYVEEIIYMDEQKGIKFTYSGPDGGGSSFNICSLNEGQSLERIIFLDKNGAPYQIEIGYVIDNTINNAYTLNKILSTFKFLD